MTHSHNTRGFTLIELLVVIAIISILAAIMFPAFASAKVAAKRIVSISNLKQLTLATIMYVEDSGGYPLDGSPVAQVPQTTWVDHIYHYVKSPDVYKSPLAKPEMFTETFAYGDDTKKYGGYGYNYQYLGNSAVQAGNPRLPFAASSGFVQAPTDTSLFAYTQGVRNDAGAVTAGAHVIDSPLESARGSGKASGYFGFGAECGTTTEGWGQFGCRAAPAEWANERVCVAWVDGHASTRRRSQLDDMSRDGTSDNGYWNGEGDPSRQ